MDRNTPTLLAGGYRNEVWRVPRGRGSVVEKRYSDDSVEPNSMFPNLPDHEAMAMSFLAGTRCAPELVSYRPADAAAGALVVYRFVVGTPWTRGVADAARLDRPGQSSGDVLLADEVGEPLRPVPAGDDLVGGRVSHGCLCAAEPWGPGPGCR